MKNSVCWLAAAVLLLSGMCYGADADFTGLMQVRYVDNRDERATFAASTARLGATVKVTEKVSVQALFELAKEPNLLEAMIDYSFSRELNVRIGQFKLPFGLEAQLSKFDLEAINRSLILSHLWYNGVSRPYLRDVGALIFGRYMVFDYKLGAVNGVGYNYANDPDWGGVEIFPGWGTDNNNTKDIVGRVGMGVPMFAGLGFSFYEGKWPIVMLGGESCGADRSAKAFDIFLDTGKVLFQYERVWAQGRLYGPWNPMPPESELSNGSWPTMWVYSEYGGSYIVLGYRITSMIEPVFKLDMCDPDEDIEGDRMTDTYLGVNLNFERKARLQVFYRESEVARRFRDNGFLVQASGRF